MKQEILLKAYVQYQSDEAFRELVAGSLDEVYSTAARIIQGPQHLAEETVSRVYWELARKASRLGEDVVLSSWLHEHTCKAAVNVLHEEDRPVDRAALKKEMEAPSSPESVEPAPAGLAVRVCSGILLSAPKRRSFRLPLQSVKWPGWLGPARVRAVALCALLVIVALWRIPFHKRNPIVRSTELQLTPASFAQLASPEETGLILQSGSTSITNAPASRGQP